MTRLLAYLLFMCVLVSCTSIPRLHEVVEKNDLVAAQRLIDDGADVNQLDSAGTSVLHRAAWNGSPEMAELLIRSGADLERPNMFGSTPLLNACLRDSPDVANVLLTHGASVTAVDSRGSTPLTHAAARGHVELAKALIERGAAVESAKPDGPSPLAMASGNGRMELVQFLLERGARADGRALLAAASGGHIDVVQLLASRGADVNFEDKEGSTPLLMAAARGHSSVARWLCDQDARMKNIVHVFRWVSVPANVELVLDSSEAGRRERLGHDRMASGRHAEAGVELEQARVSYESLLQQCDSERAACAEAVSDAKSDRVLSTMGVFLGPTGTESVMMNARARANAELRIQSAQLQCLELAAQALRSRVDRCQAPKRSTARQAEAKG